MGNSIVDRLFAECLGSDEWAKLEKAALDNPHNAMAYKAVMEKYGDDEVICFTMCDCQRLGFLMGFRYGMRYVTECDPGQASPGQHL